MILAPLTCWHRDGDDCFCQRSKPVKARYGCGHSGGEDCRCLDQPRRVRAHPFAVEFVPQLKTSDGWRELGAALWRGDQHGWLDAEVRDSLHHSVIARLEYVGVFEWVRDDFMLLHDAVCDPQRCPGVPPKYSATVGTNSTAH